MHIHNNNPLAFTDGSFDRLALRRIDESWITAKLTDSVTRFVPVVDEDDLLTANGAPLLLDAQQVKPLSALIQSTILLGDYRSHVAFALGLAKEAPLPAGTVRSNLRPQFGVLEDDALALLGYARAMTHWHAHNRYCGKCGAPTRSQRAGHELHCTACGNIVYPRVNPAVIMLVTHGERCLL